MAAKRAQLGAQGGLSNRTTSSATHIYASSLAVPTQSNLAHLETRLTRLSQRISPFVQRDVVLSRIDDTNPYRMELEASDSSFAPLRRARVQTRLHVRFQSKNVELRVYSQGQGGGSTNKRSDLTNIKSLTCTQLEVDDVQNKDTLLNGKNGYIGEEEDDESEESSKREKKEGEGNVLPNEIDAGGNYWRQVTLAMGWIPHHTVIRSGHCFTVRQDNVIKVEVLLFYLLKLNEDTKPVTLERASNTRVLQAVVTIALPLKPNSGSVDMSHLSDRAHEEIVKLQESLRGLVDLSRDVD